jgi:hypothetical protein
MMLFSGSPNFNCAKNEKNLYQKTFFVVVVVVASNGNIILEHNSSEIN